MAGTFFPYFTYLLIFSRFTAAANNITLFRTPEGKQIFVNPATGKLYAAGGKRNLSIP